MAYIPDPRVVGVHRRQRCLRRPTDQWREAHNVGCRHRIQTAPGRLLLHNGVVVAAISDVDDELPDARHVQPDFDRVQVARDVEQPHLLDEAAIAPVFNAYTTGRRLDRHPPFLRRRHKSRFKRGGDGSDGSMTAHRQTAGNLDEQHAKVAIRPMRRVEDAPGHHIVPTRLEHERPAHPVVPLHEQHPALGHRQIRHLRATAHNDADRIAAGMRVDAEEAVACHRPRSIRRHPLRPGIRQTARSWNEDRSHPRLSRAVAGARRPL